MARIKDESNEPVHSSLAGSPVPAPLRHQFETQFGEDFSGVRIHTSHNSAALGAVAYTHGRDIHLQPGFQPYTADGLRLLGHELAHVVQQRQVGAVPSPRHTFAQP